MNKLILLLTALLIASCSARQESDPVASGRPLSFWLRTWVDKSSSSSDRQNAERAIKQLGTNAIPFLLNELSAVEKVQKSAASSTEDVRLAVRRSGAAAGALLLLGQSVTPAIPQLTILMSSDSHDTVQGAASVLSGLGPSGAHAIVVGLTNRNSRARAATAAALRTTGTNVFAEVPFIFNSLEGLDKSAASDCCYAIANSGVAVTNVVLGFTSRLQSTNPITRYVCAMTLGELGASASEALPHLRKLRDDPVKDVRDAADWALKHIGSNHE